METLQRIRANSSAGRNRTGGSQVYLYRPNLPEGCFDIPDQCIVFVLQRHAGNNSEANHIGIARRPSSEKYSGGI